MPLSGNEQLFTRKVAKAFFNLDLSDNLPLIANETPNSRDCHQITSQLRANETENKANFLVLPVELRLRIYNYLLVSRFDRTENPSEAVGDTNQKLVVLHMIQAPQYRTMEPGILQTCKQIYYEGNSILYSQNVFAISDPKQMFKLIVRIGPMNFKLIRTLHIFVPYMAELFPWLQFLSILAKQASGLRDVELHWGADTEFPWQLERGARERGLGDCLDFVRALGKIHGLEKLVIKGYYAKNWPAYLGKEMSVPVQAICGDCRGEPNLTEGELTDEELENAKYIRELNEREMKAFTKYQQGTEDLIP